MTLMHNKFEEQPEVIFITYEDVIKSPYPFILNKIDTELKSYYEPYLDLDKFSGLDMDNLLRLCVQRTDPNILRFFQKIDFDANGALAEIKNRYFEMYEKSELLKIGYSLDMVMPQKFCEKIYIYTPVYDIRVHLDIQRNFNDMKLVNYVSGDFDKVLDKLGDEITTYIVNDLDYVVHILEKDKANYTNIMLASYGYNYIYDEEEDKLDFRLDIQGLLENAICKFATFIPVDFTERHFSQLRKPKPKE